MTQQLSAGRGEEPVRQYDRGDEWLIAADLGVGAADVSVDVVGETAIVVVESADPLVETELDLPGAATAVSVNNGVLTIVGDK